MPVPPAYAPTSRGYGEVPRRSLGGGGHFAEQSAAASLTQRLPLSIRRYIRVNIAASATAGDNTAKKATLALAY